MKIYSGKIPAMANEISQCLIREKAVEVEPEEMEEFHLDIEAVLRSYVDTERRIHEEAQELISHRGLDFSSLNRLKREVAKKYNFAMGDDAIDWLTDQLIEMLYHTTHVEEIWADNNDIRRLTRPILLKHTALDEELDVEVRKKIKNLNEGSVAWDIKYQQVLEDVKRRKGLK
ncbi:MAG: DUF507 family protein [Proteobacteria bacterium]|nr:DUF507 family protein [Pseudomonadota bacterium]